MKKSPLVIIVLIIEAPDIAKAVEERGVAFAFADNLFAAGLIEDVVGDQVRRAQERSKKWFADANFRIWIKRFKNAGFSEEEAIEMAARELGIYGTWAKPDDE